MLQGQREYAQLTKDLFGHRVFIVGGGPSCKGMDWEVLRGRKVVACNVAAFLLPKGIVGWALFGDKQLLKHFRSQFREFVKCGGVLFNVTKRDEIVADPANHWIVHLKRVNSSRNWGIIQDDPKVIGPSHVSWNRSTGGCAINLVASMGAREIVLIGYDMTVNGSHNWHQEYEPYYRGDDGKKFPMPDDGHYKLNLLPPFKRIAEDLRKLEIQCWNTNRDSAITSFPYKPLEELL